MKHVLIHIQKGLSRVKMSQYFAISLVRIIDASKHQYESDIRTACETGEFMTIVI